MPVQTVVEHISGHGIAESVEEIGAHGHAGHIQPRLVVHEIDKLVEREFLGAHGFQTFLGEQTAGQSHGRSHNAKHRANHGILVRLGATHPFLKVGKGEQRGKAHGIGSDHAESRELVFLSVVGSHHSEQRSVRHVDHGVDRHHEQIEGVGVDAFARDAEVGSVEQQRKHKSEGHCTEYEPRPVCAPARLGAVGQGTHEGVGHYIKHACHQHEHSRIGKGKAEDVGEKQRERD